MTTLRKSVLALVAAGVTMTGATAGASTTKEWQAAAAQAQAACSKASGLRDVKAVGDPAIFDDTSPLTAVLIKGVYPQAHMKGQAGTMLCLYDRKTRRARAVEWAPSAP